ncbi:General stress protein 14 [Achromobacter xylosoxidans]|uniref:NAD(P)H-dependent oxidoreductase n=1 Tax=Alcaligenes xylosoxydans xylosoxydans TaxID=85698 RepID=UPI0006C57881|nr:NAD(P)H-dependent oxidoreductase [Achromobacter xylosoxidans]CUJ39615.1 General stress protein 14 [Achromobacter xylosoxidans]
MKDRPGLTPETMDDNRVADAGRRDLLKAGATLAVGASVPSLMASTSVQAQTPPSGGAKTLILASHPYPDRSVVNKALWEVAQEAEGAYFRNLETVYGDNLRGFDRAAERRLYQQMERLVLIFPIHWFNLTPMLKAYMNEVWGSGAPPELRGKELFVVTTTAGGEDAYSPKGRLGFTIEEVLTPLRASANYTGMKFAKPLCFFAASGDASALRGYQQALAARLREQP